MKKTTCAVFLALALSACSVPFAEESGEVAMTRIDAIDDAQIRADAQPDPVEETAPVQDENAHEDEVPAKDGREEQDDFLAAFDEANARFNSYTVCITDSRAPGQSVVVSSEIVDGMVMTYRQYFSDGSSGDDRRPDTLEMKDGMFSLTLRGDPTEGGWEVSAYIAEGDGDAILSLAGVFDYFHESWHTDAGMYIDKDQSTDDTVVVVCSQPVQETVTEIVTDGTGSVSERIYYIDAETMLARCVKEVRRTGGDADEITEYVYSDYNETSVELPDSLTSEMGDVREIFEGYRKELRDIEAAQEELTGPGYTS